MHSEHLEILMMGLLNKEVCVQHGSGPTQFATITRFEELSKGKGMRRIPVIKYKESKEEVFSFGVIFPSEMLSLPFWISAQQPTARERHQRFADIQNFIVNLHRVLYEEGLDG